MSEMNKRFDGFLNTPFLWRDVLKGLQMFSNTNDIIIDSYPKVDTTSHIRLGKLIEQFVEFELNHDDSIELLTSSLQVFRGKVTIGELDCLLKQLNKYIHLEIVYKFYLYDPTINEELNRWIGPNRNDSLIQKLTKLREKQLPLLYKPETNQLLEKLNLAVESFIQEVYFKAQLFVPYPLLNESFLQVNNACVKGFYIRKEELHRFENYTFYIPSKLDWLVEPHVEVEWNTCQGFERAVSKFLLDKKSPLCWLKSPEGKLEKFFVVWWE